MRDDQSRIARLGWVGWVRCSPPGTMFVTETVGDVAWPSCRHDATRDACVMTLMGTGRDHLTQPTHPNQTDRERAARLRTFRENIRTVVSGRRFLPGQFVCGGAQRIGPPASGGRYD